MKITNVPQVLPPLASSELSENEQLDILNDWLETLGFTVLSSGGNCPFEVSAVHRTSNLAMYFRSRWWDSSIEIWEGTDYDFYEKWPETPPVYWGSLEREDIDAGWISPLEALDCIRRLLSAKCPKLLGPVNEDH